LTGLQPFVGSAPVNLIYVSRASGGSAEDGRCTVESRRPDQPECLSVLRFEGLATVVRGMVNREPLAKALKLPSDQRIIVAQTVGYPAKP